MLLENIDLFAEVKGIVPPEQRKSFWYQRVFEDRLSKLKPLDKRHNGDLNQILGTNAEQLKRTAIVLYKPGDDRYELLISGSIESFIGRQDHEQIISEYGLSTNPFECMPRGYYFEDNSRKRYMIFESQTTGGLRDVLHLYSDNGKKAAEDLVRRYRINEMTCDGSSYPALSKILWDDLTLHLAHYHRWTYLEWLGFRVRLEWPNEVCEDEYKILKIASKN